MKLPTIQLSRVPVWMWRALMTRLGPGERRRFNEGPIDTVDYRFDIDYVGDGIRQQTLDVISPKGTPTSPGADTSAGTASLPVYVYFHGGGWTSGDKAALTKYCASQAVNGMVVVNVNYRTVSARSHMKHMLQDAAAALDWVRTNVHDFGGDPDRIVLGGDSAGGQIAALLAASETHPELAKRYSLSPNASGAEIKGVVQHCSAVDFSVILERGFIMSLGFVRMLLPRRDRGPRLVHAIRYLSPIEWLAAGFPEVFVTTSERDFFYRANLNFIERLRMHAVPVDVLIYGRAVRNTRHTWQQNARYPESQEVYRRLHAFVRRVTSVPQPVAAQQATAQLLAA